MCAAPPLSLAFSPPAGSFACVPLQDDDDDAGDDDDDDADDNDDDDADNDDDDWDGGDGGDDDDGNVRPPCNSPMLCELFTSRS